jgi:hypothetical protein
MPNHGDRDGGIEGGQLGVINSRRPIDSDRQARSSGLGASITPSRVSSYRAKTLT